jgi:hypothetical protein
VDLAVEGASVDFVEADAAAEQLVVVSLVDVVFEPLRHQRKMIGTSARPEGFQPRHQREFQTYARPEGFQLRHQGEILGTSARREGFQELVLHIAPMEGSQGLVLVGFCHLP